MLASGLKYLEPRLRKAGLPWASEALLSRLQKEPVHNHPPALFPLCASLAIFLRSEGLWRVGALIHVAHASWMRPGETVEVCKQDVSLPEDIWMVAGGGGALIRVAPGRRPAKSGRQQPTCVPPGAGLHALRALYRCTASDTLPLGGVTVQQYYRHFVHAVRGCGFQHLGLTLFFPRTGGATGAQHRGAEQPEMTRRGRWASVKAMLQYLDQLGALAGATRLSEIQKVRVTSEVEYLYQYFPELRWGFLPGESAPNSSELRSLLVESAKPWRPAPLVSSTASPGFRFMNVDDAPPEHQFKRY